MKAIRLKSVPNIEEMIDTREKVLIDTFCYVGERCIIEAREGGNYLDQTGNLRSSIGYAVILNGKIIQMGIGDVVKTGDKGNSKGEEFLTERIKKAQKRGIQLIVTAGMNYAEYVEAKGYNVLTSAELKAELMIHYFLTKLGFKQKINHLLTRLGK